MSQITSFLCSSSPRLSNWEKCQIFPSAFPTPIHPQLWQHVFLLPLTHFASASLASSLFLTHLAKFPPDRSLHLHSSHLGFSLSRLISSLIQLHGWLPHFFQVSHSQWGSPSPPYTNRKPRPSPHPVLFSTALTTISCTVIGFFTIIFIVCLPSLAQKLHEGMGYLFCLLFVFFCLFSPEPGMVPGM